MRLILRDLSPGQDYAVQFQSVGDGIVSDWSPVYRFRTDGDITSPAPITGLVWKATGSSFLATWNAVTLDGDGSPLRDFKDYEVTVTASSTSKVFYVTQPSFELTLQMNADAFGSIQSTVTIDVKSRDQTGNKSIAVSATAVEDTPPKPSTPIVEPYFGGIQVSWDGNPATGVRNELNLDHVEIHASKTTGFTPTDSTLIGRFEGVFPNTQIQTFTNLDYGSTYYIRLVAINRFGRAGTPSDQASATPIRITNLDIEDGQIGVDQINFTAYDIGGANAYYPSSVTAMNAIANAKPNDIAYVTGAGYATYRYNGSIWVSAPEIGVIQGSKILAGTVTSNAVGTNLLITAAANIADAVIDNAKITSLDGAKINAGTITAASIGSNTIITNAANIQDAIITSAKIQGLAADKITAGTINSVVIVSGKLATAASGARREMNSVGFQAWDASNNLTINLDGINNLLTGIFQTALSGRRLTLGASGSAGRIDFWSPTNYNGFVYSYTQSGGTTEAIQFGMVAPSSTWNTLWNRLNINASSAGEYTTLHSGTLELMFDISAPNSGSFQLFHTTNRGDPATAVTVSRIAVDSNSYTYWDQNAKARMQIDGTRHIVWDASGNTRMKMDSTDTTIYDITGDRRLVMDSSSTYIYDPSGLIERVALGGTEFRFRVGAAGTSLIAFDDEPADTSTSIGMTNTSGVGGRIYARTPSGTATRFEFTNIVRTGYIPLMAADYLPPSSAAGKSDIRSITIDPMETLCSAEVKSWRRKGEDRVYFGWIAEEAPAEVVVTDEDDKPTALSIVSQMGLVIASLQQVNKRLSKLEGKNEPKK